MVKPDTVHNIILSGIMLKNSQSEDAVDRNTK